jgi:hypothetical protein
MRVEMNTMEVQAPDVAHSNAVCVSLSVRLEQRQLTKKTKPMVPMNLRLS